MLLPPSPEKLAAALTSQKGCQLCGASQFHIVRECPEYSKLTPGARSDVNACLMERKLAKDTMQRAPPPPKVISEGKRHMSWND